jgi:hypothetical protein
MGLTGALSDGISAGPMAAKLIDPLGGARLLERTRTFRDRVKAGGGSIEDGALENLYDPILRKVKEWGLLSDLVFFGAASAVEINSGSIPTIFGASGNENDATQSDTAKQPTKETVNGRIAATGDGSDDILLTQNDIGISGSENREMIVVGGQGQYLAQWGESSQGSAFGIDLRSYDTYYYHWSNDIIGSSSIDGNQHLYEFQHKDGVSEGWLDEISQGTLSLTPTTTADPLSLIGRDFSDNTGFGSGKLQCVLVISAALTNPQKTEIRDILNSYYNL